MALIVSKLAQISGHVIGSVLGRWRQNPGHVFSDILMLVSLASARLKYIPYSNQIRLVFGSNGVATSFDDFLWNEFLRDNESKILDPESPKVRRVTRVLVRILQALCDGLMLQHGCSVTPNGANKQIIVPSRRAPLPEHKFEHLDGRNWELVVLEAEPELYCAMYYAGHGRIVMDVNCLDLHGSENELAHELAHEVGHGVGMHPEGCPSKTLMPFALVPWTSALWGPAMFIRICDLYLYCCRRMELEADYIGLMLMASAGYDPRRVPNFWKERPRYGISLDTTHPCNARRAEMMSQEEVMDRAIQTCRQVRAGHGVPSFIQIDKRVLFNPNFNPFITYN